ncbi:hypothetical protein [uncultured Acinetobacter sp.]|uniref:hypothetical protein n=1 Tax=uncultured Acinetobacter sp. TaxID=165433 RepID=UPI0025E0D469|nr:hypothetical protein [uncultured Acinetobacter sp.]
MFKKNLSLAFMVLSSYSNAEYKQLELHDINKYHICSSGPFAEVINMDCDKTIIQNLVLSNDDRISGKYTTYKNDEKLYIITPYNNVEKVLDIVQEEPLDYTISTFNNNFSGIFYLNYDENRVARNWYVKCDKNKKSCTISSEILSIYIDKNSTITEINNSKHLNFKSIEGIDRAIDFSKWAISKMN